jgi:hypothetical protein
VLRVSQRAVKGRDPGGLRNRQMQRSCWALDVVLYFCTSWEGRFNSSKQISMGQRIQVDESSAVKDDVLKRGTKNKNKRSVGVLRIIHWGLLLSN